MQYWTPGASHGDLLKRVRQAGVLGKKTAYRTRNMVNRVFRPRLLMPDDKKQDEEAETIEMELE